MTTVFLIRHTQAEGNLYRAMQGHWDGGVTRLGLAQIETLRNRMKGEHIDAVYSSDLYRACITAKKGVADDRNLEVVQDARLRELDMGPWERHFFGNLFHDYPEQSKIFMFDSENWYWPGAETFDDVRERMYAAVEDIAKSNEGRSVAIVSHGVSLRCFLSKVYGVDLSDVNTVPICKNTAVTKLEYESGKFRVIFKNDYSHLGEYDPPKWNSTADIRDVPLNPYRESAYYNSCYEEGWRFAHAGSSEGFDPISYLSSAGKHFDYDPNSVLKLLEEDTEAGLVDLDPERGKEEDYGWISLIYLKPEYRGKGYGVQALARGILKYENLGRKSVRLCVNKQNRIAIRFYEKYGFYVLSDDGRCLLLERKLSRGRDTE